MFERNNEAEIGRSRPVAMEKDPVVIGFQPQVTIQIWVMTV